MADQETIIIGGGHNGLICAIVLARAGQRVTVLEAGPKLGGMAAEREFYPGFKSALAQTLYAMPSSLIRELDLTAHGLEFAAEPLSITPLSIAGTPSRLPPHHSWALMTTIQRPIPGTSPCWQGSSDSLARQP